MLDKVKLIATVGLFVILLSIAIPTLSFQYKDRIFEVSNINPIDYVSGLATEYFEYKPAIDLQGGYIVTFDIKIPDISTDKVKDFKNVESVLARRISLIGIRDFELTSFYSTEENIYKLNLTTADQVDKDIIGVLTSPGELNILIDDLQATEREGEGTSIFDGRVSAGITNEDIAGARVVSDSRVYTNDPENPNNYGIMLFVKPEAKERLQTALITNSGSGMPLIFTLDGSPVAVQASGYAVDPYGKNDRILLYTLFADTKLDNSVIASAMISPNLDVLVTAENPVFVSPRLGAQALQNLKITSLVSLVVCSVVAVLLLKKKSIYVLVTFYIYLVTFIALQKILNLNLSLALVLATMLISYIFMFSQIALTLRFVGEKFSKSDLNEIIKKYSLSGWKTIVSLLIVVPLVLYFENLLTSELNQFIQVFILGLITWVLYRTVFFRTIFNSFTKFILE